MFSLFVRATFTYFNRISENKLCFITKTCLYKFDPLNPILYGKTGAYRVYIIFSYFCLKNIDCLDEAVITSTHNLCFEQKYVKY